VYRYKTTFIAISLIVAIDLCSPLLNSSSRSTANELPLTLLSYLFECSRFDNISWKKPIYYDFEF